jgi:UDP-N-acetyl-D-mannosaminuronic acid dehydrogenase
MSAKSESLSLAIVGGCGHVGLPLGIAFAQAGAKVTLVDTDQRRVGMVAEGQLPFLERGAEPVLTETLRASRLRATCELSAVKEQQVVIVTIGTPVDEFLDPSVGTFDRALEAVLDQMVDGQLLVLRSTVFPGITDRLVRRVAQSKRNIDIAYCPERIAQGYALEELGKLPQVIGGATPQATERAIQLFEMLGAKTITLTTREAELAKLFSNAYRYLNFAISNQFYMIAERLGADFDRIHAAVTTEYPRMGGFAKAGFAGGPCLLKDTMQLAAFNHNDFALGQAAMMVNEGLPRAVVDSIRGKHSLAGATVAILGMAFKGNSDDPRDSLSYKLRKILTLECEQVLCTDPYITDPQFVSLETALADADILFIGACHSEYKRLNTTKPIVDVFGFVERSAT